MAASLTLRRGLHPVLLSRLMVACILRSPRVIGKPVTQSRMLTYSLPAFAPGDVTATSFPLNSHCFCT